MSLFYDNLRQMVNQREIGLSSDLRQKSNVLRQILFSQRIKGK